MLQAMHEAFGTEPEDVVAAIGPSICKACYEVSDDVAEAFRRSFPWRWSSLLQEGSLEGKFQLDLWEANRKILLDTGIIEENLQITDICTCCNSEYLFSHRASKGQRGNLAAFLELRKS